MIEHTHRIDRAKACVARVDTHGVDVTPSERAAALLLLVEEFGGFPQTATILTTLWQATSRYDQKEANFSGGSLHCFLEDCNHQDTFLDPTGPALRNDPEGIVLAGLWRFIPEYLRSVILRTLSGCFAHAYQDRWIVPELDSAGGFYLDTIPQFDDDPDMQLSPERLMQLTEAFDA